MSTVVPVEEKLLESIASGRLKPGERLPPTPALASELGVDLRSVQRALASLAARGYLDRRPRIGTFVRAQQEKATVGLLTGWNFALERNAWPRRMSHLLGEELRQRGYRLHIFDNLFAAMVNDPAVYGAEMERLRAAFEQVNPAGFIEFQCHLSRLGALYPTWNRPGVHLGRMEYGGDVVLDQAAFITASVHHLASLGCRRLLWVRKRGLLENFPAEDEAFWKACKRGNFLQAQLREVYVRTQHPELEAEAEALMGGLMAEAKSARRNRLPDAIMVSDDVMMRGIVTALLKAGVRAPEQPALLAMTVEGFDLHYGLPVIRYEYPMRRVAGELVRLLDLRLRKQPAFKTPLLIEGSIVPPSREPATPPSETPQPLFHHAP
ncbi:MAG TPA: GntR family transcriptional regulator [Chthoniobacteraceae bacterium]|nr:GntR family transcriptional regulator [Chthoniobacteraceae bacterium]